MVEKSVEGGVSLVQLRDKEASAEELYYKGAAILPILKKWNVPLIINDHWSVAKRLGVGLHIGIDDGDPREARDFLGSNSLLGITVHTDIQRVFQFQKEIDYVGVGPVFPTSTKKDARPVCGIDGLKRMVDASSIPVVSIGGIDAQNIALLRPIKPAAVAVCSAICSAADPKKAVQNLIQKWRVRPD